MTEPKMGHDLYLATEVSLTESEREAFLAAFTRANPHWRGAHVADVLAVLDCHEAHLAIVEPLHEAHAAEWSARHRLATYVAIWAYGKDWATWERVSEIATRRAPPET